MADYLNKEELIEDWNDMSQFYTSFYDFIENQKPADVIEREQYEKLKKENIELKINNDDAEKRFCHAMDEKAKLLSKIDNAIEEIEQLDFIRGENEIFVNKDFVLKILKEI